MVSIEPSRSSADLVSSTAQSPDYKLLYLMCAKMQSFDRQIKENQSISKNIRTAIILGCLYMYTDFLGIRKYLLTETIEDDDSVVETPS